MQHLHRLQGDQLARLPGFLEAKRRWRLLWMLRVPFSHAALAPLRHEPVERPADGRMVRVTEVLQGARGVPGRAKVAFLVTFHRESAVRSRESFNPEIARPLDPRIRTCQSEVRQDGEHPV